MNRRAFAPGVIEAHRRQRGALTTWLIRAGVLMAATSVVMTAAFLACYHWG